MAQFTTPFTTPFTGQLSVSKPTSTKHGSVYIMEPQLLEQSSIRSYIKALGDLGKGCKRTFIAAHVCMRCCIRVGEENLSSISMRTLDNLDFEGWFLSCKNCWTTTLRDVAIYDSVRGYMRANSVLKDRTFIVRRTNGNLDDGWKIVATTLLSTGEFRFYMTKHTEDQTIARGFDVKDFVALNAQAVKDIGSNWSFEIVPGFDANILDYMLQHFEDIPPTLTIAPLDTSFP